jgi:hypothetical protein
MTMPTYLWNILIWLDQGLSTVTGGDPDETVSSRAGKAQLKGKRWGCVLCRFLDIFDKGHCAKSIEYDEGDPVSGP